MVELRESPHWIQTSLAGAMCLGLEKGKFARNAHCACLNLLLVYENGCSAACSYCGLARNRQETNDHTFIRVKWPTYKMNEILHQLVMLHHPFKRVCVSMITHRKVLDDTCLITSEIKNRTGLPVSVLVCPTVLNGKADLQRMLAAGADRVGIAIDAATPDLFARHRGLGVGGPHQWDRYWSCVKEAIEVFGRFNVGIHLIVGLGETEKELVHTIESAHKAGALTHLFSFFPENGSILAAQRQPELGNYRRIQLARYLINEGIISTGTILYNERGQIIDYGIDIDPYLNEGIAFMTSGCPGEDGKLACNRPYGNERASEPMRNYPFVPDRIDVDIIHSQFWDGVRIFG